MSNNESSKSPTRPKLADKTTKGKGGLETRVYLSDTEEKGGSVKTTEVEHDGQVVARKVEKDGKVVESSATPDVQHTDAVNGDVIDTAVGPAVSQMREDEVKSDELEKARDPSKSNGLESRAKKHCAVVKFLEFRSKLRELSNKNSVLPVSSSYRESKIREALDRQAAKGSPYAEPRRSAGVATERMTLSPEGAGVNSGKPKEDQKKKPTLRLVKSQGIANTLRLLSLVRKHLSSERKDYDPAAAMASPEGLKIKAALSPKIVEIHKLPNAAGGLERHLNNLQQHLEKNRQLLEMAMDKTKYPDIPAAERDKRIKMAERALNYLTNGIRLTKVSIQARDSENPKWSDLVSISNPKISQLGTVTFSNTLPGHNCPARGTCGSGSCYGLNGQQAMGAPLELRARNSGLIHRKDFVQGAIEALRNIPKKISVEIDPESFEHVKDNPLFKKVLIGTPQTVTRNEKGRSVTKVKFSVKAGDTVRWHDTGDILNQKYADDMYEIMKAFPEKKFYAYTKSLHLDLSKLQSLPNFHIIQSVGGKHDDKIDITKPHTKYFPDWDSAVAAGYEPVWYNDYPALMGHTKIGLIPHGSRRGELNPEKENIALTDKNLKKSNHSVQLPDWVLFDQPDIVAQEHHKGLHGKMRAFLMRMSDKHVSSKSVGNDKLAKDDKPHAAGSPEDSAHDVVEEGSSLKEELKALGTPSKMRKMLEHLRLLKDTGALRSEQNREVGLAKTDLNTVWNPFYRGPAQTPPPAPPPPPRERSGMDMITSINTAGARARGLIKSNGDAEDVMAKAAPEGVSESKYKRCKEKVAEKQGGSKTSPYNVYAVCRASLKKSVDILRKAKVDEYLYGDRPKIKRIVREERRVASPDPLAAKPAGTNLPKGPKAPEAPELKKAGDGPGLPKGLLAVDSGAGGRSSEAHYWFDSEENARSYADGLYKHPDRTAHVHKDPEQIRVGDKTHTAWRVRVRSWSLD